MDPAAVGVAQKEDDEQGIDEQDIFHHVVFFLAAITGRLFRSVLGADDAPFGPVMGKRGEAGAAAGTGATGVSAHLRVLTTLPPTSPSRHLLLIAEMWACSLCQPGP